MERFGRPWLWLFTCLTLVSLFQLMQCAAADGESWQIFIVSFFFYVRPFLAYWANIWRGVNEEITTGFLLLFYLKKKKNGRKYSWKKREEMKRNWIGSIDWRAKTSLPDIQHLFPSLSVSLSSWWWWWQVCFLPSFHPSKFSWPPVFLFFKRLGLNGCRTCSSHYGKVENGSWDLSFFK